MPNHPAAPKQIITSYKQKQEQSWNWKCQQLCGKERKKERKRKV